MTKACQQAMQKSFDHDKLAFENATAHLETELAQQKDKALSNESKALAQARREATTANTDSFARARWLLGIIFRLFQILSIASWTFVIAGFIGLLAYLFGRISFDSKNTVEFSLKGAPGFGGLRVATHTIRSSVHDRLDLSTQEKISGRLRTEEFWYVSFDAARHGDNTHMRLCLPQWHACFFRRLFNRRLLLTCVPAVARSKHQPIISAPGDLQLVDCIVEGDNEIVFKMCDLIAFSSGVKLRSIYSMHVATELFGLGAFYCVASGDGRLVLCSQGREVRASTDGLPLPAGQLLAWSHQAMFSLAQESTQCGAWLNTPSLKCTGNGSVVYDEGRPGDPRISKQVWRLLRFAASPI